MGMPAQHLLQTGACFTSVLVTAVEQPEATIGTCQCFLALTEERPRRWLVSMDDIRDPGHAPIALAR